VNTLPRIITVLGTVDNENNYQPSRTMLKEIITNML